MDITVNDSNSAKDTKLQSRITNEELSDRVKKLASRQPSWPKGYRQQYRPRFNNKNA